MQLLHAARPLLLHDGVQGWPGQVLCSTADSCIPWRHRHRRRRPLPAPLARLLVDCNQLAVDIDNEIVVVYNFIRDKASTSVHLWWRAACIGHCAALAVRCTPPLSAPNSRSPTLPFPLQYKTKFPELESLVHSPLEYARVVQVGGCRRV